MKSPVPANTARAVLGRASASSDNLGIDKAETQEALRLAYLNKMQQGKADQSKAQANTRFFAYGEQGKTPDLKTTIPPSNYALSLNTPTAGQAFRDSYAETSLSDASGQPPALRGDNAADRLAGSTENNREDNGIAIQVRDSRRGFTSSLRLASKVQTRDGRQVLTLHIEEEDANASSDAYTPLPGEVRMEPK